MAWRAASVAGRVAEDVGELSKIPLAYPAVMRIFGHSMRLFAVLSTFLLLSGVALSKDFNRALSIFAENDIGFSDRYYTNGIKIQYTQKGRDFWVNAPQFWILDLISDSEDALSFETISLGQAMYVPQDIDAPIPPSNDRPYAGWLYLNAASHVATKNSLDSFAITLGVVGRHSYAEDIQRKWHDIFGFDMPAGWDNQLEDEFGFVISYKHSQRVWRADAPNGVSADAVVSAGADLGNVITQGYLSVLFRVGYSLPFSFDAGKIGYCSSTDVRAGAPYDEDCHLYFLAGASARFIGYDITLDGNAFASSDWGVDSQWFVFEPVAGVSARWRGVELDLLLTYRTREFKGQGIGHHTFWTISLKYFF